MKVFGGLNLGIWHLDAFVLSNSLQMEKGILQVSKQKEKCQQKKQKTKKQQIGLHLTEVSSIVHSTSTPVYAARMEPRERCEHPSVHAQGI